MALDIPLSSYVPVRLLNLIDDLKSQYPSTQHQEFVDLSTMLRAVCLISHDKARRETLSAFWKCNSVVPVLDAATDNTEERVFLLNFHFLMKRGNYSLLSRAEYECADNDGFLLDVASTMNTSKMDPTFLTGFFDAHPEIGPLTESFEQNMLVYHRGVGKVTKTGRFVASKVELLKDFLVGLPLRNVLGQGRKAAEASVVHHPLIQSRRSLRTTYPTAFAVLKGLLSMTTVEEPTLDEVVLLYRRAPPPAPKSAAHLSPHSPRSPTVSEHLASIDGQTDEKKGWVVLKSYSDVPLCDIELCFPDTIVQVPTFEVFLTVVLVLLAVMSIVPSLLSGQINGALGTLVLMVVTKVVTNVTALLNLKTTLGFKKNLALYDKTRDAQEGVITHNMQMMLEQELIQILLAYTLLLTAFKERGAEAAELDRVCEEHLLHLSGKSVDFNVAYALDTLQQHRLVARKGKRWVAVDLKKALEQVDNELDNMFQYNTRRDDEVEAGDMSVKELKDMLARKEEEVTRLQKQQALLCAKVKQLDEAMMEL